MLQTQSKDKNNYQNTNISRLKKIYFIECKHSNQISTKLNCREKKLI